MHVMRHCWMNGIIDENTLVWGQGLVDWLPVRNVRTLVPHIRTVEGERMVLLDIYSIWGLQGQDSFCMLSRSL